MHTHTVMALGLLINKEGRYIGREEKGGLVKEEQKLLG